MSCFQDIGMRLIGESLNQIANHMKKARIYKMLDGSPIIKEVSSENGMGTERQWLTGKEEG